MSRSGYTEGDDCDNPVYLLWPSIVRRSIQGKRGQAFLKELLQSLDAMPDKRLISEELQDSSGAVCAIGSVGARRGIDMSTLDPEDFDSIAQAFKISPTLVREIEFHNDDGFSSYSIEEAPAKRWERIRRWVSKHIIPESRND